MQNMVVNNMICTLLWGHSETICAYNLTVSSAKCMLVTQSYHIAKGKVHQWDLCAGEERADDVLQGQSHLVFHLSDYLHCYREGRDKVKSGAELKILICSLRFNFFF